MSDDATQAQMNAESLKAILVAAFNRLDRLPALQSTLERAATECTETLRTATQPPPTIELQGLETNTVQDLAAQHEGMSVIGTVNAPQWNTELLLLADRAAVFSVVEMLLGGDGTREPCAPERAYSAIELGLLQIIFAKLTAALESAFEPIARTAFSLVEVSSRINPDTLGGRNAPVVVARFAFGVHGRHGELALAMPASAIDALRPALARGETRQTKEPDALWSSQMQNEITRTSVSLSAILDEHLVPLEEIAALKLGQIMPLDATAQSRVRIECDGEPLFWCMLGKSHGRYTLRVDETVDREQEFVNGILGG
jgi:flagellar motor switch protein FliM